CEALILILTSATAPTLTTSTLLTKALPRESSKFRSSATFWNRTDIRKSNSIGLITSRTASRSNSLEPNKSFSGCINSIEQGKKLTYCRTEVWSCSTQFCELIFHIVDAYATFGCLIRKFLELLTRRIGTDALNRVLELLDRQIILSGSRSKIFLLSGSVCCEIGPLTQFNGALNKGI